MSVYTDINTNALIENVSKAIEEINSNGLETIQTSLNNAGVFNSSPKEVVLSSLDTVNNSLNIDGSLQVLKNNLNKLYDASIFIQSYQTLEKEVNKLEKSRFTTVKCNKTYYDEEGNSYEKTYEKSVEDSTIVSQINSKSIEMKKIDTKITNLLS